MTSPTDSVCNPGALGNWHPVLRSTELRGQPVGVKVLGQQLVLFRGKDGLAGALEDRCRHRGARLSTGFVQDNCVVCPYHLWTYDREGRGHSPVNPNMKAFTSAFEVAEYHNFVWVKQRSSTAALPAIEAEGYHFVLDYSHVIHAPFPLVVDNFTEIEHSPTNHFMFAFDAEGIKSVEPNVTDLEDSLNVVYVGPQRPFPWWTFGGLMGMKAGNRLVINFKVNFSPIHWIYDISWEDPKTGQKLPQCIREFAFITPLDDGNTGVVLFFYATSQLFSPRNPLVKLIRRLFFPRVHHEFMLDKRICENVADMDPSSDLNGRQLGKFDHVLRSTRKLIQSVYNRSGSVASEPSDLPCHDGKC